MAKEEKVEKKELTPYQRVAAHPKGAIALIQLFRALFEGDSDGMNYAIEDICEIYDEIFDEPAMMPRFLQEVFERLGIR